MQIKSSTRVKNFAEVNTNKREINNMLDLVKHESLRIDSRFLEPACGDGAFLKEILTRKLKQLEKNFSKNQFEFEKFSIIATGSIYGIELLEDNVTDTRKALFEKIHDAHNKLFKESKNVIFSKNIKYIIEKNIIHGDALTLTRPNSSEPIVFSEWSIVKNKIKRRDFTFSNLLNYSPFAKDSLFSDLDDEVWIPSPSKDFPLIEIDKLYTQK